MDPCKKLKQLFEGNTLCTPKTIDKIFEDAQQTGKLVVVAKKLNDLPSSIINYDLSDIYLVDLSRNSLTELPCFLQNFLSLEELICQHNLIRTIPKSISTFLHLVVLDLSHNLLTNFPPVACEFECLQVLNISSNRVSSLPDDIGRLQCLMELNLSRNMIAEFPDSIGKLTKLKQLSAHHNQLKSLNTVIAGLPLEKLDVSVNKISRVPLEFHIMTSLDDLNISFNPLIIPPQHVVERGRQHIMAFLASEHYKQERQKLRKGMSKSKLDRNGLSNSSISLKSFSQDGRRSGQKMSHSGCSMGSIPRDGESIKKNSTKRYQQKNENHKMSSCLSVDTLLIQRRRDDMKGRKSEWEGPSSDDDMIGQKLESPKSLTSSDTLNDNESSRDSLTSLNEDPLNVGAKEKYSKENGIHSIRINNIEPIIDDGDDDDDDENAEDDDLVKQFKVLSVHDKDDEDDDDQSEFYKRYSNLVNNRKQERAKVMKMLADKNSSPGSTNSVVSPKCKKFFEALQGELADHDPLLTIRRNVRHLAKENAQVKSLRKIFRTLLKAEIDDDVGDSLKDGVLLCELANQILPNSVPKFYKPTPESKLSQSKSRKNVESFLNACRKIGLTEDTLCHAQDVLDFQNKSEVIDTVLSFVETAANPRQSSV